MDASDWQTKLASVRERNSYALKNSLFCDVEFSVVEPNGNKVVIPVHKYVLATSSPVFQAMFFGKLAETRQVVDLHGCTKEGIEELLRYIYTDEVSLTENNVMEVMMLADKYMLPFLVEKCNQYLQKELKPKDVFVVLPQVQKIDNKNALKLCWDIVDKYTQQAVSSQPFLSISRDVLCQVLSRESLYIEEIELFKAVDRWSSFRIESNKSTKKKECSKRAELGDEVVKLIRFPVMSQKEFATHVLPSDILLKREMVEIMQVFSSVKPSQLSFNNARRKGQKGQRETSRERWSECRFPNLRFMSFGSGSSYGFHSNHTTAAVDFQVNKRVSLAGVRLFGIQNSYYRVNIRVYKDNGYSILYESYDYVNYTTGTDMIDGLYHGFTVVIDPPAQLKPNTRYTINADIEGPSPSFQGSRTTTVKSTVICDDVVITFMPCRYDRNGNSYQGRRHEQFPSFLLKWTECPVEVSLNEAKNFWS